MKWDDGTKTDNGSSILRCGSSASEMPQDARTAAKRKLHCSQYQPQCANKVWFAGFSKFRFLRSAAPGVTRSIIEAAWPAEGPLPGK